jgi:urease accessory protein
MGGVEPRSPSRAGRSSQIRYFGPQQLEGEFMTCPRFIHVGAWSAIMGVASLPTAASAHVLGRSAGDSLAIGFAHPFSGLDHQLVMFAIGLWAALCGGRARLALPVAFVGGAVLGLASAQVLGTASAPGLLAASVIVVGGCVAFERRSAPTLAILTALACGSLHGHAHASDLAASAAPSRFAVGFLAATVLLHAAGFGIAAGLPWRVRTDWTRAAGGAIAAAGAVLVAVALR